MSIFVWVKTPRGPSPQTWAEIPPKGCWSPIVLYSRKLTAEEEGLTLDELASVYPAPPQEDDDD